MIGTTSELGPPRRPRSSQDSASPPARCGIIRVGLPGACACPSADMPCLVHSRAETLRPSAARRSVLFRPRAFPTPRRLAPKTRLRAYCSPLPAGVHCASSGLPTWQARSKHLGYAAQHPQSRTLQREHLEGSGPNRVVSVRASAERDHEVAGALHCAVGIGFVVGHVVQLPRELQNATVARFLHLRP